MIGDGGFFERDLEEQMYMFEGMDYDYMNLEFYTRGGNVSETTAESTSSLLGETQEKA